MNYYQGKKKFKKVYQKLEKIKEVNLEISPVASLIPTMLSCSDSVTIVSSDISTEVLPGTLYKITGSKNMKSTALK